MSAPGLTDVIDWKVVDPLDPNRYMLPMEQNQIVMKSYLNTIFLFEEIPDIKKLENAFKKVLETFPVLLDEAELMPNGIYRYVPQPVKVQDFTQLYENAPTVSNNEELIKYIMSVNKGRKITDSKAIKVTIIKIDKEKSKECRTFRGKYEMIMYLTVSHTFADGISMNNISQYINNFYTNPDYKLPFEKPQLIPITPTLNLPKDVKFDDSIKSPNVPLSKNFGFLNSDFDIPYDDPERTLVLANKVIEPGVITKLPINARLTSQFTGVESFIILALIMHQHSKETNHKLTMGQIRLCNPANLDDLFGIPFIQLYGTKILSVVTNYEIEKGKNFGIYELTYQTEQDVEKTNNKIYEQAYYKKLATIKRVKEGEMNKFICRHTISNVGKINLPEGPIKFIYGFAFAKSDYGVLHVCPTGQSDGSMLLLMTCDSTCFTLEFANLYLDVFEKLWRMAKEHDVFYEDFIKMPEYTKLCELLDEKKPDWMKE